MSRSFDSAFIRLSAVITDNGDFSNVLGDYIMTFPKRLMSYFMHLADEKWQIDCA